MTLGEPAHVVCPYCFEGQEIWLEVDVDGDLVWDCEVCCQPWAVRVWHDADGHPQVHVDRAQ